LRPYLLNSKSYLEYVSSGKRTTALGWPEKDPELGIGTYYAWQVPPYREAVKRMLNEISNINATYDLNSSTPTDLSNTGGGLRYNNYPSTNYTQSVAFTISINIG